MTRNYWTILTFIFFISSFSFAQKEKEISVKIGKEKLYGTITTVKSKKAPVVIIIPGSGPTNRDGNSPGMSMNSYSLLAKDLAKQGIASIRYDKLGIGKSKTLLQEKDLRFEDNTQQVTAWIDYLQKKKFNNIILLGHSEGVLIGSLAAQQRTISKFISIAGIGRSIDEVLLEQLSELPDELYKESEEILYQFKNGNEVDGVSDELLAIFRESIQPYMISWIKLNPAEELGKLDVPTLIVQGSTDFQVSVEDAELLKSGKEDAQLEIIEGMSHILKEGPKEKSKSLATYFNPGLPLHKNLIPALVSFIKE